MPDVRLQTFGGYAGVLTRPNAHSCRRCCATRESAPAQLCNVHATIIDGIYQKLPIADMKILGCAGLRLLGVL